MVFYQLTERMGELRTLKTSQLVDMLAEESVRLIKLFTEKNIGEEYEKCKQTIVAIQSEIEQRKRGELNTNSHDFS